MSNWLKNKKVEQDYIEVCREAALDDSVFANFKSDPRYTPILEHVTQVLGAKHLSRLGIQFPNHVIEKLRKNDSIGNPMTDNFEGYGIMSPTTIRYIDVAWDIDFYTCLNDKNIVEIGGGYGGQCYIIHCLSAPKSYFIHDLPEVMALQRKYLGKFGIELTCHPDTPIDLVISNYAWSELGDELRKEYIDTVISRAAHGYFTINGGSEENTFKMIHELTAVIDKSKDARVFNDIDDKHPNNRILVW